MGLLTMLVWINLAVSLFSSLLVARLFWDISRNQGSTVRYPTRRLPSEPSAANGESRHKDVQTERQSSPP